MDGIWFWAVDWRLVGADGAAGVGDLLVRVAGSVEGWGGWVGSQAAAGVWVTKWMMLW